VCFGGGHNAPRTRRHQILCDAVVPPTALSYRQMTTIRLVLVDRATSVCRDLRHRHTLVAWPDIHHLVLGLNAASPPIGSISDLICRDYVSVVDRFPDITTYISKMKGITWFRKCPLSNYPLWV